MSRQPQMNHNATPYEPSCGSQGSQLRPTTRGLCSDTPRMSNPPLPVVNNRKTQSSSNEAFRTSFPTEISSQTHQTQDADMANKIPSHNYQISSVTNTSNRNPGLECGLLSRGQANSIPRDDQDINQKIFEESKLRFLANLRKFQQELVIRPSGGASGASKLIPVRETPPCMVRNGLPLIYNLKGVNWEHAPLFELQRVSGRPKSWMHGTRMVSPDPNYTNRGFPLAATDVDRIVKHVRGGAPTGEDVDLYHLLMLPTDLAEELD